VSAAPAGGGAVVTGAAGGLGLELGRMLAARGFTVHLTDLDEDTVGRAAAELRGAAFGSVLDVRDEEACRAVARATAERAGSLSVWINNASVLWAGLSWEQEEAGRRTAFEVNALGTINGTIAALELMRSAGRGHILNVVSLAGLVPAPGEVLYSATKHAALAFSVGTRLDLRRAGVEDVEISCLCPDGIWTPMITGSLEDPHSAASFSGKMLTPHEVAEQAARLLDRPVPVLSVPRRRGALARSLALWPRILERSARPLLALGRLRQRRLKRRVDAESWPAG
jgi:short-subunit dehydrogenase